MIFNMLRCSTRSHGNATSILSLTRNLLKPVTGLKSKSPVGYSLSLPLLADFCLRVEFEDEEEERDWNSLNLKSGFNNLRKLWNLKAGTGCCSMEVIGLFVILQLD